MRRHHTRDAAALDAERHYYAAYIRLPRLPLRLIADFAAFADTPRYAIFSMLPPPRYAAADFHGCLFRRLFTRRARASSMPRRARRCALLYAICHATPRQSARLDYFMPPYAMPLLFTRYRAALAALFCAYGGMAREYGARIIAAATMRDDARARYVLR